MPSVVDDPTFSVAWNGTDATSGIASFDVQSREDDGGWTDWLANTSFESSLFSGRDGHNYSFRARARDRAGNAGAYPGTADSSVRVDIPVPVLTITCKPSMTMPEAGSAGSSPEYAGARLILSPAARW